VINSEREPAGELALKIADQGWAGLLPILAHDATPNVRLKPENAELVEKGRGKAPGTWARAGWSLLREWRDYPDDLDTIEAWAQWPGVNAGMRACHAAPWVAFVDVDVVHAEASGELMEMLRRRLQGGDFIWRVGHAPRFLIPVHVTEPVNKSRSTVVEIDGQKHMVEVLARASRLSSPACTRRHAGPTFGQPEGSRRPSRRSCHW
jgi:hypothetical protein